MGFLQHTIDQAGELILAIPSALIILLSREWYCARMAEDKESHPFRDFPLISFASLCLTGTAAGGLLRDRPYALLRFLHGQLWLVLLIVIGVVYALIKNPAADSFSARFSAVYLCQAWSLFIVNFIPLPPFDAAATYFSPYMQWRMFTLLVSALSLAVLVFCTYDFWRIDFLTGKFLTRWLSLA